MKLMESTASAMHDAGATHIHGLAATTASSVLIGEHLAPARRGWPDAQPKQAQASLGDDRVGYAEARDDQQRPCDIGQISRKMIPHRPRPEAARREDEVAFAQ